ncbi:type IV pilus assembly protein PilM [Pseudomonas sp. LD120]|uniref:type IV pilus assembly protein PilM n=1 Tax=Pseudomonas sp. LD120 TaxID=485751 RepID=UPI00135CBD8E|nr:type IV pilus assembly protein PilM [Pseudomonas sp. LD120]KAF0862479.1 type IV pilus assembly protein PilM [Pseudomonas sp. LD120]
MLGLFSKKPSSLLGIDINAASVTLLALSRQGAGYRVEAYAREALAANVLLDQHIADPEAVAMALSRAWRRSGSRLKDVAVAVAGDAVISKVIEVPAGLSDDDLESQLALEAGQYIPYPLEDVALDFEVQGCVPGKPLRQRALLVACRNELVESLESVLALAELTPRVVDTQPLALERCLLMLAAQLPVTALSAVALLDIGPNLTTFSVLFDRQVIYAREQLFGTRPLMAALEQRFALAPEAVLLAQRQGGLPEGCNEALQAFEQEVLQQASRSLQLFADSPGQPPVAWLLLAGEGSRLVGLDRQVERQVGIATRIANPFLNMSVSSQVDARTLADDAPSLLLACGLAMRGFD